jgi:polysaccharide deacetylase family protein (PEP-CTERM system associated)
MIQKRLQRRGLNTTVSAEKYKILLTVDVEDWFQVENFKSCISYESWDSRELRVADNTIKILDLLDSFRFTPKATFFVLGWVAKRLPDLVREIASRGHEVASHGYGHDLCSTVSAASLVQDLTYSKKLLEDILGVPVIGYRAPSFSISGQTLDLVRDAGYLYDSSFNSFGSHERYGHLDLSHIRKNRGVFQINPDFYEIPVSNLEFGNRVLPLGGGGYFRLFPFQIFKQGMKAVLKKESAFVFYAHPWEFDPDQPRVDQASAGFKFRHYINLHRTEDKISALIRSFSDARFTTCQSHLKEVTA